MSAGFWVASISIAMAILAACLLLVLNEAMKGSEDDDEGSHLGTQA